MARIVALSLLIAVVGPCPAIAQQLEQANIQFQLPPLWCDGVKRDGGLIFLENYVDKPLPPSVYILSTYLWIDGAQTSSATHGKVGNMPLAIDPQLQYTKENGWPYGSNASGVPAIRQPFYYKLFGFRRIEDPNNYVELKTPLPMRYSAGDGIAQSAECSGGNGTPLQVWAGINIIAPTPGQDLKDLPTPSTFYERKYSLLAAANAGSGNSARNLFLGPPQATTKFRAHVLHRYESPMGQVQHLSVCLQAGNTSNCQSAPVQLKFGSEDNYNIIGGDAVWSNTIDFNVPAGQNVLVTASTFVPGQANYWSISSAGGGVWISSTDAWNTVSMSNATFYANFTQTVDWVQMW